MTNQNRLDVDRVNRVNDLGKIVNRPDFFRWSEEGIDLRPYSTIGIGGRAACVVRPINEEEIRKILEFCRERGIPYSTRGNGSNTVYGNLDVLIDTTNLNHFIEGSKIVSAEEIKPKDGILIAQSGVPLGRRFSSSIGEDNRVKVEREPTIKDPDSLMGCYKGTLAAVAYKHSLSGVEYLCDIPGTVGGATVMNAGVYQQWLGKIYEEGILLSPKGERVVLPKEDFRKWLFGGKQKGAQFRYRLSSIQTDYRDHVLYAVKLKLNPGNQEDIKKTMFDTFKDRKTKHPAGPSVGSVFVLRGYDLNENAIDFRADELIEKAGCAGYCAGGIRIAKEYPVFFINDGNATLENFISAMRHVYQKVKTTVGISLKPEVKFLPYEITPQFDDK